MKPVITIIGAGLVGALLATLLAQRGFAVTLFERRPDPRRTGFAGGRSINLALADRGWHGLRLAGLSETLRPQAVMMRGRIVHALDGKTELLRYGRDDNEVIWSVNRGRLNVILLDAAEAAGATIHFNRCLQKVNWENNTFFFCDDTGMHYEHAAASVIGADGAGSALREAMAKTLDLGQRFEPLGHSYKELEIPRLADASSKFPHQQEPGETFAMQPNALHIWPRGGHMCIALPNADGSFTVTLFLPNSGEPSFASVTTAEHVRALFEREFDDIVALIPDLQRDFLQNPTGTLGTLYLDHWHLDSRALLIGDAAHPIVPFHGQGMNAGFEDAVALMELLEKDANDIKSVFALFAQTRKPNADAIAAMALENYIEMRDRVDDPDFLLMRELERMLAKRHPGHFVPRYWMVTFSRVPYAVAYARGQIQAGILRELTAGKTQVEEIDLKLADQLIRERLPANLQTLA